MRALLLAALWVHLVSCVLLVGAFSMLLLAGQPPAPTARRWDQTLVSGSRRLVLLAIGSGIVWLLLRTAVFENRPQAALEPRAVWHAVLDTWPGLVWLARHGLLIVLGTFLAIRGSVAERRNWIAARGEALVLATLALALTSASSHAAAITPGTTWAVAVDVTHLVGTGLWVGSLVALAPLVRAASRDDGVDSRAYAVLAVRRFSRAALGVMLVLMASGVLNAIAQVESIAGLAGTTHGRLLVAKLAVLVPILVLAAVNRARILPVLSPSVAVGHSAMRRLTVFVGLEAALALVLLVLAAAMTLTTPARHAEPVWPLPFRLSLDVLADAPATRWRALLGSQLAVAGMVALIAACVVRRRRAPVLAGALALVALGGGVGLPPLVVDAYPTTYKRPLLTYHAASIASGMTIYGEHCAACHGAAGARAPLADLRLPPTSRRHAGEIFWLVSHGIPQRGMPDFASRLGEARRWDVINFIRALGAADGAKTIGRQVELDRAWLAAPDFTVAVGPLAPGALRDHRGRRMVLLVLYTLPGSRARMTELARGYDVLSVVGVEVIAVPTHASSEAIRELGSSPPVLFPVITDGTGDIVATYGMFAPGPHAEILIDRQGYIRAIWRGQAGGMPQTSAVQAQVEKLNEEKSPPPFPDDHVH
ncbi:MAG TPA: CopD family protein [Patescibacteria group bacterium]|nr:CopD family protein [Patescibacteria group bacterium]